MGLLGPGTQVGFQRQRRATPKCHVLKTVPHQCPVFQRVASATVWKSPFKLNRKVVWEGGDWSILQEILPVLCAGEEGEG